MYITISMNLYLCKVLLVSKIEWSMKDFLFFFGQQNSLPKDCYVNNKPKERKPITYYGHALFLHIIAEMGNRSSMFDCPLILRSLPWRYNLKYA